MKIRDYKIIIFTIVMILTISSNSWSEIVDRVIAKINSDIITLSEMKERALALSLEQRIDEGKNPYLKKIKNKDILDIMIEEILQIQYAKKVGIKIPDEYVYSAIDDIKERNSLTEEELKRALEHEHLTFDEYRQKIRERMIISRVIDIEIKSRILVEEDEIRRYYEEHKDEFMISESINVRHIFFLIKEDKKEEAITKIRIKAEEALKRIRNGADFIEMAQHYSEGPNAASGGETGFFKRGTMAPEFENIAFSLKEGEISGIIQTKFGFHIIKAIEKRDARPKRFEDVKETIKGNIFEIKSGKKYLEWIKELRKNSYIDVLLNG